jgi:eukaryotic-like serine/threonine-protein kinase
VKPANILVGPDRVVLTDFGIACAADNPTLTAASGLIGSPSYIAPERATGSQSGAPSDLWGLGASLYAAVEGRPPFDRDGPMASLNAVVTDEPDPAEHAGPLWPVISGLLRKDPRERLDAAETERMLRRVVDAPRLAAARVSPLPSWAFSSRSRGSRGSLAALAGSAALAVLVASGTAVGFVLTNSAGQQATPAAAISRPPAASAPLSASSTRPPIAVARQPTASTRLRAPSGSHLTTRTAPTRTWRPDASQPGPATARSRRPENTRHGASWVSLISHVKSHIRGLRGWHHRAHWRGRGCRDEFAGFPRPDHDLPAGPGAFHVS